MTAGFCWTIIRCIAQVHMQSDHAHWLFTNMCKNHSEHDCVLCMQHAEVVEVEGEVVPANLHPS